MPLKLPRYVFRRANGSFRYKRNVPERLRPLIGKATLYRQLGDSYKEAMQALPLSTSRPPSWGITLQGPPISSPMGFTRLVSVMRRSGRLWRGLGCLWAEAL
mgnify:CR=1 FL=1